MSKSIAVLVCDTFSPVVLSEHGGYYVQITELLHGAGKQLGVQDIAERCKLDEYDVREQMAYPTDEQLEGYAGLVITGSRASAYEDIEWINKLVDYTVHVATTKPRIKIVGICFGHQIVARALGGRCVKNDRWEVAPTPVSLTALGKEIFGVDTLVRILHSFCPQILHQFIEMMHQDHVPEVPPTFHLLGSTDVSINQGMVRFNSPDALPPSPVSLSDIHIFTVQGHPEFHEGIVSKLVAMRAQSGILNGAVCADAIRRARWQNDGVGVVGKTMLGIYGIV
ncbi:class I glutamine amidotransferase-like protein [Mycena alexandri]|uniref:Class I glutamine amidotransferase-like protein n=1 Tax=Mycena alexandri TaxID=1745969 RepID=A0AAD6X9X0_9AGAR|nr:class I glutamine amidotransferase-like protein [Mycena alexandri]